MRIGMLVAAPLPPCEGIGFYAWNLAVQLTRDGHRVHLITRGERGRPSYEVVDGITIWRPVFLPFYPVHVHIHSLFVNRLIRRLETDLDVLHLHTPLVKMPATRLPRVVTVHTPMLADAASVSIRSMLGVLVKLQTPVSVQLERDLFRRANRIVAVAESVAHELAAYGINPQHVEVLGNGVDTDRFTPADHPPAAPYVLTVGRLGVRKGLEDLVACAAIVRRTHPECRFLIAGTGPEEARLHSLIAQAGLESYVQLLGHIADRAQLVELYQGAAAYVHPAHYEGLPTVLLEAMSCARPVIATAVSGALDVVQDSENGLLVPPREPERLAHAIASVLEQPALSARLGAHARQTIRQRYDWKIVGRHYCDLYRQVLNEVPPWANRVHLSV